LVSIVELRTSDFFKSLVASNETLDDDFLDVTSLENINPMISPPIIG
jgi:hypothetical protein